MIEIGFQSGAKQQHGDRFPHWVMSAGGGWLQIDDGGDVMLTYDDCVGLTDLEKEEIEAIAQHEHVPEIVAAELGCCLIHQLGGAMQIDRIIRDDIRNAARHGHPDEALHWKQVLRQFEAAHPAMEQEAA